MRTVVGTIELVTSWNDYTFVICDPPKYHITYSKLLKKLCGKHSRLSSRKKHYVRNLIDAIERKMGFFFILEKTSYLLRKNAHQMEESILQRACDNVITEIDEQIFGELE